MLTRWLDGSTPGSAALEQLIGDLHAETGETIILAAQSGLAMRYLLTRPGRFPVQFLAPAGMLRPLCGSGTGWALLASKPDEEINKVVDSLNRSAPLGQEINLEQLWSLLHHVRQQGYAASYGNVIAGSGVIAMALPGADRTLVLGVGGPVERLQRNEAAIAEKMRRAISRCLPDAVVATP